MPGALIAAVAGLLTAPVVARGLRSARAPAWLLVFGIGVVIAATLTPLGVGFEEPVSIPRTCDLSRVGLAPLSEYFRLGDTSLNVALFMPLGVAVGLLPGSHRKWIVVAAAIVLPFAIETLQLLAPVLARGCQSADVVDNLIGLVLGMVGATGARWLYEELETRG